MVNIVLLHHRCYTHMLALQVLKEWCQRRLVTPMVVTHTLALQLDGVISIWRYYTGVTLTFSCHASTTHYTGVTPWLTRVQCAPIHDVLPLSMQLGYAVSLYFRRLYGDAVYENFHSSPVFDFLLDGYWIMFWCRRVICL